MINAVDSSLTETATGSSLFDGLDGEAFLTLLIAQLQYQDPMAPTDPSSMLEQTSQFANVEAIQKQNELQSQVLGYTQFQSAASLIGRDVTFSTIVDEQAVADNGVVTGVRTTASGPRLTLADGGEIGLLDVLSVAQVTPPDNPELTPDTPGDDAP